MGTDRDAGSKKAPQESGGSDAVTPGSAITGARLSGGNGRRTSGRIDYKGQTLNLNCRNDDSYVAPNAGFALHSGSIALTFNANRVDGVRTLLSRDSLGYDGGGHLTAYIQNGQLIVRLQSDSEAVHVATGWNAIRAGREYDIRFDFGDGGMKLFVDGKQVNQSAYSGGLGGTDEPVTIGAG